MIYATAVLQSRIGMNRYFNILCGFYAKKPGGFDLLPFQGALSTL